MPELNRINYEKDIDYFKKSIFDAKSNTINKDEYQKWFMKYVDSRTSNSMRSTIEAINEANFIVLEACKDNNVKKEETPINGDMSTENVVKFILDKNEETAKKDTIQMMEELLEEQLANKAQGENQTDGEKKDDDGNDTTGSPVEALAPKSRQETIDSVTRMMSCYLVNKYNKKQNDKKSKGELDEDFKEISESLRKKGASEEEIFNSLRRIEKEIADRYKEQQKSQNRAKEKQEYNPYQDYKYLYYMWTLGVQFNLYISKETKEFRKQQVDKTKEISRTIVDTKDSGNTITPEKSIYDQKYILKYISLKSKYGLDIDVNKMRHEMQDAREKVAFQDVYKKYMKAFYSQGRQNIKDMVEFVKDFDGLVSEIVKEEGIVSFGNYAGMSPEDFSDFTMGIREDDCNLTKMLENELTLKYGEISKIPGDVLANYVEARFNKIGNFITNTEIEKNNNLRDQMACYLLLEREHASRSKSDKFLHFYNYHKEANALQRMNDAMTRQMEESKMENEAELKEEFQQARTTSVVFKEGFVKEKERFRKFTINMRDAFKEIKNEAKKDELKPTHSMDIIAKDSKERLILEEMSEMGDFGESFKDDDDLENAQDVIQPIKNNNQEEQNQDKTEDKA